MNYKTFNIVDRTPPRKCECGKEFKPTTPKQKQCHLCIKLRNRSSKWKSKRVLTGTRSDS